MIKRIQLFMDANKKRIGLLILCIAVLGTLGTGVVFAANKDTTSDPNMEVTYVDTSDDENSSIPIKEPTKQELLSEYGPHGITFDEDGNMYYFKEPVRYFWDGVDLENNTASVKYEYFNENGTVDVHTVRQIVDNGDGSTNPMGDILGIAAYSKEEFNERILEELKATGNPVTYVESDGTEGDGETIAQMFSKYKDFGIEYVEEHEGSGQGNVYYNGQLVNLFVDENNEGGIFSYHSVDKGKISVYTVYDESGKLIGVEIK